MWLQAVIYSQKHRVGRGREGWGAARHLSVETRSRQCVAVGAECEYGGCGVSRPCENFSKRTKVTAFPHPELAREFRPCGPRRGGLSRVRGEHSATTLAARSSARSVMLSENERRRIRARQHAAGDAGGGSTDDGTVDEEGGVSRASTPVSTGCGAINCSRG